MKRYEDAVAEVARYLDCFAHDIDAYANQSAGAAVALAAAFGIEDSCEVVEDIERARRAW